MALTSVLHLVDPNHESEANGQTVENIQLLRGLPDLSTRRGDLVYLPGNRLRGVNAFQLMLSRMILLPYAADLTTSSSEVLMVSCTFFRRPSRLCAPSRPMTQDQLRT